MSHPIPEYLERALEATVEVACAFPADKYDFWPTPQSMTVGEQITHLADTLDYIIRPIAARIAFELDPDDVADGPVSRLERMTTLVGEVLARLSEDNWEQVVEYPDGFAMTPQRAALVMLEHDAHHRGQLIVALRLLGIDPPRRWPQE